MNYLQEVAQLKVELSSAYIEVELTQATMEQTEQQPTDNEYFFKRELYKVFEINKRHLIPKETYNKTIEELKTAAQESSSKSRHDYYVLGKYETGMPPTQPDDHLPVSQSDLSPPHHVDQLPVSQPDNIPPLQIDCNLIASQPDDVPPPQHVDQLELIRRNILNERKMARKCHIDQAERMVKRSRIELQTGNVGDNVALPVPMVDRGRGDPRNILGVIINKNENDLYTIATRHGILSISTHELTSLFVLNSC
ncbi:hypothetical protein Pmani_019610 [Petrolisthes manimaculis]|uniref:Uncharacterized protein n=1 Tax=Petrolisthes manimaculis TaxID=1843537 RepID=A0AAE1U5F8_9EUCA|nr:hypothetical protein Pmani_019610 [Petrolisthes manimaculis]